VVGRDIDIGPSQKQFASAGFPAAAAEAGAGTSIAARAPTSVTAANPLVTTNRRYGKPAESVAVTQVIYLKTDTQ